MGLISKHEQKLLSKVILYSIDKSSGSAPYCIAKVVTIGESGAHCEIISTNIFFGDWVFFHRGSIMDNSSRVIKDISIDYLMLFQEFSPVPYDESMIRKGIV